MLNKALLVPSNNRVDGMAKGIIALGYLSINDGNDITVSSGGVNTKPFVKAPFGISTSEGSSDVIYDLKAGDTISGVNIKRRIGIALTGTGGTYVVSEVQEGFYLRVGKNTGGTSSEN